MQIIDELLDSFVYFVKMHDKSCPVSAGKSNICICKPILLVCNDGDFYMKAVALLWKSQKRRNVGKTRK